MEELSLLLFIFAAACVAFLSVICMKNGEFYKEVQEQEEYYRNINKGGVKHDSK